MAEDRELLVNLRNGQRAEVPLSEQAGAVREDTQPRMRTLDVQQALAGAALFRLRARAAEGDEVLADLLTVLGLA